jgi:hypothetical protein
MTDAQIAARANSHATKACRELYPSVERDVGYEDVHLAIARAFVIGFAAGMENALVPAHRK